MPSRDRENPKLFYATLNIPDIVARELDQRSTRSLVHRKVLLGDSTGRFREGRLSERGVLGSILISVWPHFWIRDLVSRQGPHAESEDGQFVRLSN